MNNNHDIAVIGFGGCGINIINGFPSTVKECVKLAFVGEEYKHNRALGGEAFYYFDKIEDVVQDFAKIRLCLIIGGLGGHSCSHIEPLVKKLREMGIIVVVMVTFPMGFEGPRRKEHAEIIFQRLQYEADAVLVFSNDEYLKNLPPKVPFDRILRAVTLDVLACMTAIFCSYSICYSYDNLICNDVKYLKSQLYGLVLHGVGRSKNKVAIAIQNAVNEIKVKISENKEIESILLCIIGSIEKINPDEIDICNKRVMEAFPKNINYLFTTKKNMEINGFSVVLLASMASRNLDL